MFADALREIRFHPGRFLATLIAIAISVGFLAAVSIFMTSQVRALGTIFTLPTSGADVVIAPIPYTENQSYVEPAKDPATLKMDQLTKVNGVAEAEPLQVDYSIGANGDNTEYLSVIGLPSPAFRWTQPVQGRWPTAQGEIVLASPTMDKLGLKLGDQVELGSEDNKATVVGIADEPPNLFGSYAYGPRVNDPEKFFDTTLVKLAPGADPATVTAALEAIVKPYGFRAQTLADYKTSQTNLLTSDINVLTVGLQVFGVIALVVGVITIANTFNILVVQRRRQIGLLRAVGASGSQLRRRQLVEALVLGLLGSLLGLVFATVISLVGMWATKSLWSGLAFPAGALTLWVGVGVFATVLAAIVPAARATRVAPLEALQPVPTSEAARRASWVRLAICVVLVVAGAALAVAALTSSKNNIVFALGAGALLAIGVLVGAVFLVPWLTRALGSVLSRLGATPRLAVLNALRNPRRTSATATALMLAIGLIVMLQVGLSTTEKSALDSLKARTNQVDVTLTAQASSYSPDSQLTTDVSVAQSLIDTARAAPGVQAAVPLQGFILGEGNSTAESLPAEAQQWAWFTILAPNAEVSALSPDDPLVVPDDVVLVPQDMGLDANVTQTQLPTADGGLMTLKVKRSRLLNYPTIMVSPATLAKLSAKTATMALWLKLTPDADLSAVMSRLSRSSQVASGQVQLGGGAVQRYELETVIRILTIVLTALMGVAVLVALVGVANTLGLSILERMRESALLRAMGMQRSSLRRMLLIEALIITFVGVLIGVVAGAFFAWLGVTSIFKELDFKTLSFSINWTLTLGLVLVAAVAAALASIVPGRRAALAAPTEALAAE